MKEIIIYQENSSPLLIEDEDDSKIEEFSRTLANLLETNNVSILHTSKGSVIIRPNKITSIVVNEINVPSGEQEQVQEKEEVKEEITEDIITD